MESEALSSAISLIAPDISIAAAGTNEVTASELDASILDEEPQKSKVNKAGKPLLKRGPRGPREDLNRPRTAEMVNNAILKLNERGGSSIQAIKKFIAQTYKIDTKKKALFIKKYLVSAVEAGVLYRTRGSGAAGSFQISKRRKGGGKSKPGDSEPVNAKEIIVKRSSAAKKTTSAKSTLSKKVTVINDEKTKKSNASTAKPPKSTSKSKAVSSAKSSPKKTKVTPKKVAPSDKPKKDATTKIVAKSK